MEYFRTDVKVGAFILVAIALLVFGALTVGQLGTWFQERHSYTVLFPNANLLHRRAKVAYAGLQVGEVTDVTVQPEAAQDGFPVEVLIMIRADVPIRNDSRITLKTDGFIGDRFLDISPGNGSPLLPGERIRGIIGGLEGTLASVSEQPLGNLLGSVRRVLGEDNDPHSLLATLASLRHLSEDLRARLAATLTGMDILLASIKQDVSAVSQKGGQTLERLDKTLVATDSGLAHMIGDVRSSLEAIRGTLKTANTFLASGQQDIHSLSGRMEDVASRFQRDTAATLTKMQQVLTRLEAVVTQNDRNLYRSVESLRETLDNLKIASEQVRANPAVLLFGSRQSQGEPSSSDPAGTLQDRGRVGRYDRIR